MKYIIYLFLMLASFRAYSNVLGDMQTFQPNTDGLDFITVHTARPLPQGFFVFSNYLNYAKDHLLVYKTLAAQDRMNYEDSLFEYDFGIGYGITNKLQVSLQAPVLLEHRSDVQDGVKVDIFKGMHSLRPGFKYTIDDSADAHWAILGSVDVVTADNSPYTGVTSNPIGNIEGVYRWRTKGIIQALNLGYRFRNPTDTPADAHMFPLKNQLTASYGLSGDFSKTARWVFEAISSYPIDKEPYKEAMDASSFDLLLGLKHRWYKNLNFDWGATVEPGVKSLAPSYRVFAGLIYYWKPFGGSNKSEPNVPTTSEVPAYFRVLPDTPSIYVSDTVQFYAEGNDNIESCRVIEGPGTLDNGCEFLADAPGVARIEFKNARGQVSTNTVNIQQRQPSSPVAFSQKSYEVFVGSTIQMQATGGTYPYHYSIESGEGELDGEGLFQAPLTAQTVKVIVTDASQQTARATVRVIELPKADKTIDLTNLEFITATATLTANSRKHFNDNINQLRDVRIERLIVEGHTDSVGNDNYNLNLSRRRAKAIRDQLIDLLKLAPNQVEGIGFGESRPIRSNDTAEGRQRNRRVILKVYYKR
jgi:outer membrane protein OmpA-like peptidoglycan-associated protein